VNTRETQVFVHTRDHSFETRPGPAGRPGAGTGPSWWKNRGRKNSVWPGWPGQGPVTNPLIFVFFLFFFTKTTSFWFFLKNWSGRPNQTRWPSQNPKPEPWTGPATKPGLKTLHETQPQYQTHTTFGLFLFYNKKSRRFLFLFFFNYLVYILLSKQSKLHFKNISFFKWESQT